MAVINVAKDFSQFPYGRTLADGAHSGEAFRDNVLFPKLRDNDSVTIELDEAAGYGSSFLEEAFGGLIRKYGFQAADVWKKLHFVSNRNPYLVPEIKGYLFDAR